MAITHSRNVYSIGVLWIATITILGLIISTWYVGSGQPVAHIDLWIFFGWLLAVPVVAVYLERRYP